MSFTCQLKMHYLIYKIFSCGYRNHQLRGPLGARRTTYLWRYFFFDGYNYNSHLDSMRVSPSISLHNYTLMSGASEKNEAPQPAVRNGSWLFRAKKFLVSRMSYSGGGRYLMSQALGFQERKLVDLMFKLITRYSGKGTSDLIRKYFYNIMGKVWVLVEQGTALIEERIAPLREPNFLFASYFLDQLRTKDPMSRNTMAVQQLLKEATSHLIGLLPILFKEETVNKAINIIEHFEGSFEQFKIWFYEFAPSFLHRF